MSTRAVRSRLLILQQDRRAAALGRELLDSKREAILRELLQRVRRRNELRESIRRHAADARRVLREACVENGTARVDAAVLAQPVTASIAVRSTSLIGVQMPRLHPRISPFAPQYGIAATSARLDEAGRRYTALLAPMAALAEAEEAVRNLQTALRKAVRRLKAVERIVIPTLEREMREVTATLEEEERDESIRRKIWLARDRAAQTK
jgi:V/A-type H+-transporting ATPase subunit D